MTKRIIYIRNTGRAGNEKINEQSFDVADNFTGLCSSFSVSEKPIGNPPIYLIRGKCGYVVDYNPDFQKAINRAYNLALSFAKSEGEQGGVEVRNLTARGKASELDNCAQTSAKYRASGKFIDLALDHEMKQTLEYERRKIKKQTSLKCTKRF